MRSKNHPAPLFLGLQRSPLDHIHIPADKHWEVYPGLSVKMRYRSDVLEMSMREEFRFRSPLTYLSQEEAVRPPAALLPLNLHLRRALCSQARCTNRHPSGSARQMVWSVPHCRD